jgi:hypothetical protein
MPGAVPPAIAARAAAWQNRAMDSPDPLDYRRMMEKALRGVIHDSMVQVTESGLTGDHHFFISFKTEAEGVDIPTTLRRQHPEEMTIVLQFQYQNLVVDDESFAVTLNFNSTPQRLHVPFAAITSFVDPSSAFGLSFTGSGEDSEVDETDGAKPHTPAGKVVPFTPNRPTEAGG